MAWKHGEIFVDGQSVMTSWRHNPAGVVTAVDLPKSTKNDTKVVVAGTEYAVDRVVESHVGRNTFALISQADHSTLIEEALALEKNAKADYEGIAEVKIDKPRKG